MRVLITGAAGFIGSHLAARLHDAGHETVLVDDLSHGSFQNRRRAAEHRGLFLEVDVREVKDLSASFLRPDVVYHLAAISNLAECQSDPATAYSVNVAGTANLLELSRRAGVKRFVFVSSSAVWENGEEGPDLVYSMTKGTAEELTRTYAKNYGMEIVVARPYNVYGPGQSADRKTPCLIPYLIRSLLEDRAPVLYGSGEQGRDWIYVDDVVDGMEMLLDAPLETEKLAIRTWAATDLYTGHLTSLLEIYRLLQSALGVPGKAPLLKWGGTMWDSYPDLFAGPCPLDRNRVDQEARKGRLHSWISPKDVWSPKVALEEGLRRTVAFYRQEWGL